MIATLLDVLFPESFISPPLFTSGDRMKVSHIQKQGAVLACQWQWGWTVGQSGSARLLLLLLIIGALTTNSSQRGRHDVSLSSPITSCISEDFPPGLHAHVHTELCGAHMRPPSSPRWKWVSYDGKRRDTPPATVHSQGHKICLAYVQQFSINSRNTSVCICDSLYY